jgi:hypothetical protein
MTGLIGDRVHPLRVVTGHQVSVRLWRKSASKKPGSPQATPVRNGPASLFQEEMYTGEAVPDVGSVSTVNSMSSDGVPGQPKPDTRVQVCPALMLPVAS